MAAFPLPDLAITRLRRKRWTVEEYERLSRSGFLQGRYELIDGEIIEIMPPNPPHSLTVVLLSTWLRPLYGPLHVRIQDPILLPGMDYEPQPDIVVTREPATAYAHRHPDAGDILLAAEVSDTSLGVDLGIKASAYAVAGIAEYWVLDIAGRRLIVHQAPQHDGYQRITILTESASVSSSHHPGSTVHVAALLPTRD